MVSSSKPRLQELDALRGVAAFSVMLFHYFNIYPKLFPVASHLPRIFWQGGYGVLLFFAISGFVIAFSLSGTRTPLDFVVKRFARLYPVYWAAMACTLVTVFALGIDALQPAARILPANLTMLQGFLYIPSVDGVYWTLGVELAFYACMLGMWMVFGFARLEPILALWLVVKVVAAQLPFMPSRLIMLLVLDYIPFFILGMLTYRIWAGQRTMAQQLPYVALTLFTIAMVDRPEFLPSAIIIGLILLAMLKGWLAMLRAAPMLWLGRISYALYLVHHNIGFSVMQVIDGRGMSPWIGFSAAIALSLLLASILTRWVEQPAAVRIGRWWTRLREGNARSAPQGS